MQVPPWRIKELDMKAAMMIKTRKLFIDLLHDFVDRGQNSHKKIKLCNSINKIRSTLLPSVVC